MSLFFRAGAVAKHMVAVSTNLPVLKSNFQNLSSYSYSLIIVFRTSLLLCFDFFFLV
jgi:hypothetical protein